MTVQELIDALKQYVPDLPVVLYNGRQEAYFDFEQEDLNVIKGEMRIG